MFDSIIDTPVKSGSAAAAPVSRMLGYVMGVPALQQAQPGKATTDAMTRASNMASLTAAMLLKFKPEHRREALEAKGGLSWSQQVLTFAEKYPGALGVSDAVRFSLALHFLVGIVHSDLKQETIYATAYRAFRELLEEAQARVGSSWNRDAKLDGVSDSGRLSPEHVTGLGLGQYVAPPPPARPLPPWENRTPMQKYPPPTPDDPTMDLASYQVAACIRGPYTRMDGAYFLVYQLTPDDKRRGIQAQFFRIFGRDPNNKEINFFGRMKWCAYREGTATYNPSMETVMWDIERALREGRIKTTTDALGAGVVDPSWFATRTATSDMENALQKAADSVINFVGKGVDFVTDVLCKGFAQLLGPQIGGVVCDLIRVIFNVPFANIISQAEIILAAVRALHAFIVNLVAGAIDTAFMALLKGVGQMLFMLAAPVMVPLLMGRTKSLAEGFAELRRLADKCTERNPLFPITLILAVVSLSTGAVTPETVGSIVVAFSPMIGVLLAPQIKQIASSMGLTVIVNTALSSLELGVEKLIKYSTIVVQGLMSITTLMETLKSQLVAYFTKKFSNAEQAWAFVGGVITRLGALIQSLLQAIKTFQFGSVTEKAVELLKLVPELVLAILPDAGEMIPSLAQWVDYAKQAGTSVDARQAQLRAGAIEILRNMGAPDRILLIQEQVTALPYPEAARVAATAIGAQYKQRRSEYGLFTAALRAELLRV